MEMSKPIVSYEILDASSDGGSTSMIIGDQKDVNEFLASNPDAVRVLKSVQMMYDTHGRVYIKLATVCTYGKSK